GVEHHDLVGAPDGGQPVGDGERGAVGRQRVDGLLHGGLGAGVQGAGGLVEDQHGRVAQDGARDRQTLLLTAGEPVAAFTDDRVVPVGQGGDVVVDLGGLRRRVQLLV